MKRLLTQNIQKIWDTMRRPSIRIRSIEENEDYQLKGPVNIFIKILKENFPNIKKETSMNIKETYRTPNSLNQKRNFSHYIIVKTKNAQSKENIKSIKGKRSSIIKRQTYQNYTRLIKRDYESQQILGI